MKNPADHPLFDVCLDLEVGDDVVIKSHHYSNIRTVATVIAVVREGDDPYKCVPEGFRAPPRGFGQPRGRRSYLVRRGRGRIAYWPRTSDIKAMTAI